MSRASNSLKATDVTATPIKLKYSASYSDTSICNTGIYAQSGINGPVTITGSIPGATLRYRSIRELFYANYTTGSYLTTSSSFDNYLQSTAASGTFEGNTAASASSDNRYFPTQSGDKIKIINIPRSSYGQQVSRRSFFLTGSGFNLVDDGNGNIIDTLNGNVNVGNIIYAQGFVIITNPDYYCAMDGGPTTFSKFYTFDITENPKNFAPISGAIPDCAPIVSSSLVLSSYPYYNFPSNSISPIGLVTLSEADPLTNEVGVYKEYYTIKSTYCAESDPQPITVEIVDCYVSNPTATALNCNVNGLSLTKIVPTPTPTITLTPTPTLTPTYTLTPTPGSPTPTPTVTLSPTPTITLTPTQTVTPSPTVSPTVTPTPNTPDPDFTTLYVASLKTNACDEVNFQYTIPSHTYSGTNNFCNCTSLNGANVTTIPAGTYWLHEQGNVAGARQFTRAVGVGITLMTAVNGADGGCTAC